MHVVFAPDKFAGTLTAVEAASAMATGWSRRAPEDVLVQVPMSDGGPGFVDVLHAALGGELEAVTVTGPYGDPTPAAILRVGDTSYVESAQAVGLHLTEPENRQPERATTRGLGELLGLAVDAGTTRVVLGLGGTATNDGGAGLLTALGARLTDASGAELPAGGSALARVAAIDRSALDPRLAEVAIVIASDVTNPLCGPRGASATYGPQKGADPATVQELDDALAAFGRAIERSTGRVVADLPGAGAAGGTTAGMLGFTGALVRPGVQVVSELVRLPEALEVADLVITGEGRADEQTLHGKAAMGVATLAAARATPVVLMCGALGPGAKALDAATAISVVQPIADRPLTLEESMAETEPLLVGAAARLARSIGIGVALAR